MRYGWMSQALKTNPSYEITADIYLPAALGGLSGGDHDDLINVYHPWGASEFIQLNNLVTFISRCFQVHLVHLSGS